MQSVEDAYSIRVISDVSLSDKGVFFTLTSINGGEYYSSIYFYDGEKIERITFGGKERNPVYMDYRLIYITSNGAEETIKEIRGMSEPRSVASFHRVHKVVKYKSSYLVIAEEKTDKESPFIANKIKYRYDGRGLLRTRKGLYIVNDKEVRKVLSGNFDVNDVATNESRVVVITTSTEDDYELSDVFEVDINNGDLKKITQGEGIAQAVTLSREGKIAYLGHRKGLSPWANLEVILPEEGKSFLCGMTCGNRVLTDLFDGAKINLEWVGDSIYTLGQIRGSTLLYRISDNKVEEITREGLSVRGFSVYSNYYSYFYSTPTKPSLLFYKNIYDPNPSIEGIEPKQINVDGIEGWIIFTGKENPIVFSIHGGPHMAYGNAYFIEFQFLARNGFNVIYCNPRGSQGYGEEFASTLVGKWGEIDFEDLMKFYKKVREEFSLTGKAGLTGGSYGGYMTNWIITRTNEFSCAISERGISNLISMCGTSDIGFWFNSIELGVKDPWSQDGIQKLLTHSPIYYVKNVKTPTLFIHGEEDYRCPIEQAEQMFTALKMNNIDTLLVRYQGDGHEHARRGKPKNMKDRLSLKLNWFKKYLA
jgi:dipeptidyl aminopeptidase/acylaminoacyl peptidase